jgi:hypothetical protein
MMSGEITVCASMPRRARPGRQLDAGLCVQAAIGTCLWWPVPWVAMSGSQAWPVVMMAGRPTTYRRVDARGPALCETSRYGECDERQRVQKRSERR